MSFEISTALVELGFQPGEPVEHLGRPYVAYQSETHPEAGIVFSEHGAERMRDDPQYAELILKLGRCAVEYDPATGANLYEALGQAGLQQTTPPGRETTESIVFRSESAMGDLVIKAYEAGAADLQFLVMNWIHDRLAGTKPVYSFWSRLRAALAHRRPTGGLRFQAPEQLAMVTTRDSRGIIVMAHAPGDNLRERILELRQQHAPRREVWRLRRIFNRAYLGLQAALAPYGETLAGDIMHNMLYVEGTEPATVTLLDQPHTSTSWGYERAERGTAQLEADIRAGRTR